MDNRVSLHDIDKQSKLTQDQLDAMVDLHVRFLSGRLGGQACFITKYGCFWPFSGEERYAPS